MKIAVVAQHATLLHPSAGANPRPDDIAVRELTRTLARQGHSVTVFASKHQPDVPDHTSLDGVQVEHITAGPAAAPGHPEPLSQIPAFSDPLRARWQRNRPDVIHALNWTSGLAALTASRDMGVPVVQAFSSLGVAERRDHRQATTATSGPQPARLRLEPAIGRSAHAVVATSSAVAADLARLGVPRKSVRCIPWGVDTDTFSPDGPMAKRNGKPRLVAMADLTAREPLETLIWALTKVPGAELLLVGGPARNQLGADPAYQVLAGLANSIGLADRVVFTGAAGRESLPALLRSADLVLSTCAYEPSGVTSLEAMACGKPVLAPPTGGHRDAVVDGTTGVLIPPGRPMLLAQRLRQLLAHPILLEAYGVAAVDRVKSRYSWDRIASETVSVYDRAQLAAA